MFRLLIYLGHLKEMGRANMNVNMNLRNNRATYEYNYRDPFGRGKRFANAEKDHEHFKAIKKCPCCGTDSLVIYSEKAIKIWEDEKPDFIEWIKCYTCEYHLRYNVGDPSIFNLSTEQIFHLE